MPALLVAATSRLNAAATRRIQAIGFRQTPALTLPRFAVGISTARDKVTGEIIQAEDLLAFAAN
jgi:hypothetical protein